MDGEKYISYVLPPMRRVFLCSICKEGLKAEGCDNTIRASVHSSVLGENEKKICTNAFAGYATEYVEFLTLLKDSVRFEKWKYKLEVELEIRAKL